MISYHVRYNLNLRAHRTLVRKGLYWLGDLAFLRQLSGYCFWPYLQQKFCRISISGCFWPSAQCASYYPKVSATQIYRWTGWQVAKHLLHSVLQTKIVTGRKHATNCRQSRPASGEVDSSYHDYISQLSTVNLSVRHQDDHCRSSNLSKRTAVPWHASLAAHELSNTEWCLLPQVPGGPGR